MLPYHILYFSHIKAISLHLGMITLHLGIIHIGWAMKYTCLSLAPHRLLAISTDGQGWVAGLVSFVTHSMTISFDLGVFAYLQENGLLLVLRWTRHRSCIRDTAGGCSKLWVAVVFKFI